MNRSDSRRGAWVFALALALLAPGGRTLATTRTWTPVVGGDSNWFAATNWNPGDDYPRDADTVFITNGAVRLSNSTAYLNALTITNASLIPTNWTTRIAAGDIWVRKNGNITLPPAFTNNGLSNRVWIACTNLTIDSGGSINVDASGFSRGDSNSPAGAEYGYGPGRGHRHTGGSYGGIGGYFNTGYTSPPPYGSSSEPLEPGSGSGWYTAVIYGGSGGGAVRIEATNTVTVNGTITANGGNGTGQWAGGGSGGAIYITCNTLQGSTSGVLRAEGGAPGSTYAGSGAGGRIAVIYDPAAQGAVAVPGVKFSAAGGYWVSFVYTDNIDIVDQNGYYYTGSQRGDIGTLYFPDNRFLTETIAHSGQWMVPGFTNWSPASLTLSNAWIRFTDGFNLSVTNDVAIIGTHTFQNKLQLTNGVLSCGGNLTLRSGGLELLSGGAAIPVVTCGGNFLMTSNAGAATGPRFWVFAGRTNSSTPAYGALVNVASNMTITSNSWVYPYSHPTNGGSVLFRAGNLTISAAAAGGYSNAGFNANVRGYLAGSLDSTNDNSWGPGSPTNGRAGAGYGGRGGDYATWSQGGVTYGSAKRPVDPGSGGGGWNNTSGGTGGGLVWIEASGTVTLDGMIMANGRDTYYSYCGGGSGGGIYITCRTLAGTNGILSARGGNGTHATQGTGSGGGRIAVWRQNDFYVPATVTNGTGIRGTGEVGTVWWSPPAGLVIRIH